MPNKQLTPKPANTSPAPVWETSFTALQRSIHDEFDRFFHRFGLAKDWSTWEPMFGSTDAPAINITQKDGMIHVEADLPGVDSKDVDISVVNDLLTLKGERKAEKEESGKNTYRREFRYGAFERTLRLPARVQADNVSAQFNKGVLKLDLPVAAEDRERVRKIPVQGN